jgi:riboflavin kinase/FMN adenylyltransferase
MRVHHGLDGLKQIPPGTVLTVGNFDGLHLGHQKILSVARELAGPAGICVVTFEPHPLTVLRPSAVPPRLTPQSLKHQLLESLGVTHLVAIPPTPAVLNLTAEQFWALIRDGLRPAHMIEGTTFSFGKNRGGTIDRLREWTAAGDVRLHVIEPVKVALMDLHMPAVSSSLVRWLLGHGRARDAAVCLGRPYTLRGVVVRGFQRGRTIGIPTANLDCGRQMVPADGVYVGRSTVGDVTYPAAVSIGNLPTFDDGRFQLEAHLLGYAGELYGRMMDLEVIDWVRDQFRFPSLGLLKDRLAIDLAWIRGRSTLDVSKPIAEWGVRGSG